MKLTQTQLSEMNKRDLSVVDTIIIHHSVFDKTADIEQIAAMEEASQGFVTVGYHAYTKCADVKNDNWVIQEGRLIEDVPAAALGYNTRSYDICLGGNYHPGAASFTDTPSANALKTIEEHILLVKSKLPNLKYLIGHRDVAKWTSVLKAEGYSSGDVATACPGDLLWAKMHDLRVATGLRLPPDLSA